MLNQDTFAGKGIEENQKISDVRILFIRCMVCLPCIKSLLGIALEMFLFV